MKQLRFNEVYKIRFISLKEVMIKDQPRYKIDWELFIDNKCSGVFVSTILWKQLDLYSFVKPYVKGGQEIEETLKNEGYIYGFLKVEEKKTQIIMSISKLIPPLTYYRSMLTFPEQTISQQTILSPFEMLFSEGVNHD